MEPIIGAPPKTKIPVEVHTVQNSGDRSPVALLSELFPVIMAGTHAVSGCNKVLLQVEGTEFHHLHLEDIFHGVENGPGRIAAMCVGSEGSADLPLKICLLSKEQKCLHTVGHITVVGGATENVAVVSLQIYLALDAIDFLSSAV